MKVIEDLTGYVLVNNELPGKKHWDSDNICTAYAGAVDTLNKFWMELQTNTDLKCCEVVTGEYRFKVCVGMPDHIIAYMDYVEPREEPQPAPVEMQYINRRDFMPDGVTRGDGALWPTMFPITSPGWVQIGAYPIAGRHEVGDTVLIYDRFPKPERDMVRCQVFNTNHKPDDRIWVRFNGEFDDAIQRELLINFSKGDHLSESEREAWHQEESGYQESYYQTFKR